MSKWIAEFELEDGDTMPEHMDLIYKGGRIDFHCKPKEPIKEQEPCEDAVSRQAVLEQINYWIDSGEYRFTNAAHYLAKRMRNIPPVVSQPKIGRWILTQRDKCVDINCSECGNTRIKEYAYGYTIDELDSNEINNLIAKNRMNYCECCGAKMEIKQGE